MEHQSILYILSSREVTQSGLIFLPAGSLSIFQNCTVKATIHDLNGPALRTDEIPMAHGSAGAVQE